MSSQPDALASLFAPTSVAIVGAGDNPLVFNGASVHNLVAHGFSGEIYPVNPKRDVVQGLRSYPSVTAIGAPVDTAVITTGAHAVVDVLRDCEAAGVRSATIISAGFGEAGAGDGGQRNGEALQAFLAGSSMRVIGPNTAGLMNLSDSYVPRAAVNHIDPAELVPGSVALITQSGACSNIVFNLAQSHGVGVAFVCATGDEVDVDVWDVARYALRDGRYTVLAMIVESQGDAAKIREVCRLAAARRVPIVLLRLGTSELGAGVVLTHSGSIAGNARVAGAALRLWGVVEVTDFDELWQSAKLFEAWGTERRAGKGLGVFAFSGGEAALVADHAERCGLQLPEPGAEFVAAVERELHFAKAANPFDATGELVGQPDKLIPVLSAYLNDETFSHYVIATPIYKAASAERTIPHIRDVLTGGSVTGAPSIAISMWDARAFTQRQSELIADTGCALIGNSVETVRAFGNYQRYLDWADRRRVVASPQPVVGTTGDIPASYAGARATLAGLGLPFGAARLVRSADEALAAAEVIGYPVVLKGNCASTVHKVDAGLVRVGVPDEPGLRAAYAEVAAVVTRLGGDGVVVEALATGTLQLIVGAKRDTTFGPIVLVGLGGGAAEYVDDSALALADSLDETAARELLAATGAGRYLLARVPAAADQVVRLLTRIGAWMYAQAEVAELDVNPVLVDTTCASVTCVDARISFTD